MNHPFSPFRIPSRTAGADQQPPATPHPDQVRAESGFAAGNKTYSVFAEEAGFVKEMESQLALLNRNLDQLATKIAGSSDAVLAAARPKLQALRHQAAELNEQLEDARATAEATRKSMHAGSWLLGGPPRTAPPLARL